MFFVREEIVVILILIDLRKFLIGLKKRICSLCI